MTALKDRLIQIYDGFKDDSADISSLLNPTSIESFLHLFGEVEPDKVQVRLMELREELSGKLDTCAPEEKDGNFVNYFIVNLLLR